MSSCCPHARSAGRFFSFFAHRYRKRFRKKGFEPSQKQLIEGLDRVGYRAATVLEIGCGVGHLHQSLLEQGAESAVGIDLASSMLDEARNWAGERGLSERTDYIEGDFVLVADQVDPADISLLDKVVCCYPDAQGLLEKSLARTKRVIALTYPRDRWFVRLGFSVVAGVLWLARSEFRPYVHDPGRIEYWITTSGLEKQFEDTTTAWLTQVYVRV